MKKYTGLNKINQSAIAGSQAGPAGGQNIKIPGDVYSGKC